MNKFNINQKSLIGILSSMQPICNKRTTLDITESILFQIMQKELILKSTDLEISLQSSLTIDSTVDEPVAFLISGRRIFDLVKELEGDIEFLIHENYVELKTAGVELQLNIRSAEDFPLFPERIENLMQVESEFLLSLINKVSFVIPNNHSNVALNGVLIDCSESGVTLVATDGHCLAEVKTTKYTLAEPKKWLLPKRAVLELKKILESTEEKNIFFGTCSNQLVLSGTSFNFFTKLIADSFPEYKNIMEMDGFVPAKVDRGSFSKTLKRSSCLLAGQFLSTNFSFKPGNVDIEMQNKDVGKLEESVELREFKGKKVDSRFYSPYILNGIQAIGETDIQMFIKSKTKPLIFESEKKDYKFTYLIMPVSATQN